MKKPKSLQLAATLALAAFTLTTATAQNLFVANYYGNTVSEFDSSGTLINASFASGLNGPGGLAFDSSGNLYVGNYGGGTVSEFNSSGTLISTISTPGNQLFGLAFDRSGNLYVANTYSTSGTVFKFNSSGTLINTISGAFSFYGNEGLAFDSNGDLFVVNSSFNTISEFNSGGTLVDKISDLSLNSPTFIAISPAPEPSTWALLSVGLITMCWRGGYFQRKHTLAQSHVRIP